MGIDKIILNVSVNLFLGGTKLKILSYFIMLHQTTRHTGRIDFLKYTVPCYVLTTRFSFSSGNCFESNNFKSKTNTQLNFPFQ